MIGTLCESFVEPADRMSLFGHADVAGYSRLMGAIHLIIGAQPATALHRAVVLTPCAATKRP